MPEVLAASTTLERLGVTAGVVCLTSPDLVFRSLHRRGTVEPDRSTDILSVLFPSARPAPPVTVLDGHPHTLSFLAGARGDRIRCLGVTEFGQSSNLDDAKKLHGIDADSVVDAALVNLDR
jgi:pyruvate dehydrogenase E1 component